MAIARSYFLDESVSNMNIRHAFIALAALAWLTSCQDDSLTPAEQDVATFAQQLQGSWRLDKVTVNKTSSHIVTIAPVREFACDKVASAFQAKDVVNQYTITYSDKVLHVKKHYTCRLAPEELSWQISRSEEAGENINWMTGKSFSIKEVSEATVNAEFKLAFFNLDHCSPDGKPSTSGTQNKLSLEVTFDTKEPATFRLEFSKTN